ncbi:MAG: Nif3-like dinuclear metal center hexameric protein [Planctomycetales bacterium]|nr:Nif3-like dinuclear metal center hexameric protein [Planctomycetales bacterium]
MKLAAICEFLESLAPTATAEDWDNVGLLVGQPDADVTRVMTCLTVTPASAAEAIARGADLIVTHHPMPFRPLKRITTADTVGRLLWELIGNRIAIYSAHTAWDSAVTGINQQLAESYGLTEIQPLLPSSDATLSPGSGRWGQLAAPMTLEWVLSITRNFANMERLQYVGDPQRVVSRIGVACGSASSFAEPARRVGCDVLITGEASFHACLECEASGIALVLPGHYASERFAMESLAERLSQGLSGVDTWASEREADPLRWF